MAAAAAERNESMCRMYERRDAPGIDKEGSRVRPNRSCGDANRFSTCKRVSIERRFWSAHGMRAKNRVYVVVVVSEASFGRTGRVGRERARLCKTVRGRPAGSRGGRRYDYSCERPYTEGF